VILESPLASLSLILGVLLLTLGTSFVTRNFQLATHAPLIALIVVVWLAGAGLVLLAAADGSDSPTSELQLGPSLAFCLSLALLPILVGLPFHVAGLPTSEPRATFVVIDYGLVGAVLVAAAAVLPGRESTSKWFRSGWGGWLYLALVVAAIALNLITNLNLVRATVWFEASRSFVEAGQWNSGIAALRRASSLAPGQPRYRLFLGRVYTQRATADPEHRDRWLLGAEEALLEAIELNPLDPEHYAHLGQVYHHRAQAEQGVAETMDALSNALEYYNAAVNRSPVVQAGLLREHRLMVHEALAERYAATGDLDRALAQAEAARELASEEERTRIDELIEQLRKR
jgi:hypothetical protein